MRRLSGSLLLIAQLLSPAVAADRKLPLEKIQLPPGFQIHIYADVPGARSLTLSPQGTLFVGTRDQGRVYALQDTDKDQRADKTYLLAEGLNMPNGVAVKNGALYVAEINRILRFDRIEENLSRPPKPTVVTDRYPDDRSHGWKFIAFGPDGKLYIPVGAPCNVCESDPIYASLTRMNDDGSGFEIVAHGIRNSVGFDWHPETKELWFTDNGRDWLGDNSPPDELNRITEKGQHFGFPYCHAGDMADPEYGRKRSCSEFAPPERKLGPHVAALGMRFYAGNQFPDSYRGDIFIAEHGSWNRSTPLGYRVMRVSRENGALSYEVFAEGWLDGRRTWGRPVDVLVMPDGALLVSDDHAGAIYRISYRK